MWWAVLAAIGASAVFSALMSAFLIGTSLEPLPQGGRFQHLSDERIIEWSGLAAGASGVLVASWLGRARAVVVFIAYFGVLVASAIVGALELARLCQDRLGCLLDLPSSPEDAVLRQAPSLLGVVVGVVLIPAVRRASRMSAFALEGAGAYAVAVVALGILAGVRDLRLGPHAVIQSLSSVPAVLAFLALPAVAGVVIAFRSPLPTQTAVQFAAIAAVLALPVATSVAIQGRGVEALLVLAVTSLTTGVVTGLAIVLRHLVAKRSRTPNGHSAGAAPASD